MVTEYNEKGKFFTNVITKVPKPVMIQTITHLVHGNIHVQPDGRVMDTMNVSESFLAVTDAVVYALDGQELYRCHFLTLNRDHIVWLIPDEDRI